MKQRFYIVYEPPYETTLEKELRESLERYGWEFFGSSYDKDTGERDLSFYREIPDV